MKQTIQLFSTALLILLVIACNNDPKEKMLPVTKDSTATAVVILNKDSLLDATGKSVLEALKNRDYATLGNYFFPAAAVRFSPYGFVDTTGDVKLTAPELTDLFSSNKKIHWGEQDGSGDAIQLTAKAYFEKYVYNVDFLHAQKTGIDQFIGGGNSLNNLKEVYPGTRFIEYHFSGFDKKYGGMDWTSLRLVFKEMNERYYLVAVVHDQWTI